MAISTTRHSDLLFTLAWLTAAGCGNDDEPMPQTTADSGATPMTTAGTSGADDGSEDGNDDGAETPADDGSETAADDGDADTSTGDSADGSTGGDATGGASYDTTCQMFGERAFECYAGEAGYTAAGYADNCLSEIDYYTASGEACTMLLAEGYACLSALDCAQFTMDRTPCDSLDRQFVEQCVGGG